MFLADFAQKNPWTHDIAKMQERNYLTVHAASVERTDRKRVAAEFIVSKVKEMQAESLSSVGVERVVVLESPWTELVHSLDPAYYCLQ